MERFFSRKFILTILITLITSVAPVVYKNSGVSDTIVMAVLALLGGVGVAYGFINVKDAQNPPKV